CTYIFVPASRAPARTSPSAYAPHAGLDTRRRRSGGYMVYAREGENMAREKISLEDRQEIYDTLARYVWGMDTGDIEGVVATCTPDGVVKDVTGKRWEAAQGGARGFATHFLTRP